MLNKYKIKNKVRIGLVQMACGMDPEANLAKAILKIKKAAKSGAKIVCLQELFRTQYFCQTTDTKCFDWAESIPGPSTRALSQAARANKVVVIASLFEKTKENRFYNTAVVFDADGKFLGKYRKMHIPWDPGFYEKFYFLPGDLGFKIFKTRYAKIAVLVCWDQWFPEAARTVALAGAQIIFYPTAIGWKPSRQDETKAYHDAWETIQRSHAIANGLYVASVNRVGKEGIFKFWGRSFVAEPFGGILKKASAEKQENLIVDCDLSLIKQTREEWPFFRDLRL